MLMFCYVVLFVCVGFFFVDLCCYVCSWGSEVIVEIGKCFL